MEAKKRVLAEDINNLVALTSTTTLNSTSSFHQRLTNEPTVVFSQRITIQDAIATLLLDGRPDEVYAVAVQLDISHDVPRDAITVYISTKHQVSSSTTTYLEDIWELMQRRSEDYEVFASQKMAFDLQKAHLTEKERLDNEPTVAVENYHKLIRMVYVHCFDRWIGWIRRSHNEVARFKDIVVKIVAEELLESGLESYRWLDALAYLIDQFDWVYTKAEALENQGQPAVELVYREEFPRKVEGLEIAFGLLERSTSVLTLLEDWNSRCENPGMD